MSLTLLYFNIQGISSLCRPNLKVSAPFDIFLSSVPLHLFLSYQDCPLIFLSQTIVESFHFKIYFVIIEFIYLSKTFFSSPLSFAAPLILFLLIFLGPPFDFSNLSDHSSVYLFLTLVPHCPCEVLLFAWGPYGILIASFHPLQKLFFSIPITPPIMSIKTYCLFFDKIFQFLQTDLQLFPFCYTMNKFFYLHFVWVAVQLFFLHLFIPILRKKYLSLYSSRLSVSRSI